MNSGPTEGMPGPYLPACLRVGKAKDMLLQEFTGFFPIPLPKSFNNWPVFFLDFGKNKGAIRKPHLHTDFKAESIPGTQQHPVSRGFDDSPVKSYIMFQGFLANRPSPKSVLQGAINAAIEGLVRGHALELAPVRVNAVSPGLIDTTLYAEMPAKAKAEMMAQTEEKLPVHRIGSADDVAQAILVLAANPYITGSVVTVNGGATIAL